MSYYFSIVGTNDKALYEHEFGTSKQGGDGIARFPTESRHHIQFVSNSSIDIVEEVQWSPTTPTSGGAPMYLKHIDKFQNLYVSGFITGGNVKFLLLTAPAAAPASRSSALASSARASAYPSSSNYNPTAPATEEAVRNFFVDVYDAWVKTIMSPFYMVNDKVTSPVFRGRVAGAAKKYL
ncbi:Sedlin [Lophium mytilinum]|uniref:Sedlin n=1 Tax=Lophium mytilinum TaxID=390894 RepID=A0A6A6QLZ8_9PEZI|nr:Sedlin [Lophium mytilinum]